MYEQLKVGHRPTGRPLMPHAVSSGTYHSPHTHIHTLWDLPQVTEEGWKRTHPPRCAQTRVYIGLDGPHLQHQSFGFRKATMIEFAHDV